MNSLIEDVVGKLRAAPRGTDAKIAVAKNLHVDSIRRIRRGDITNPRIQTLEAILSYFKGESV